MLSRDLQPLRVEFGDDTVTNVAQTLESKSEKEEVMRAVFQVTRHLSQSIIVDMLDDFRNKRAMGKCTCTRAFGKCTCTRRSTDTGSPSRVEGKARM